MNQKRQSLATGVELSYWDKGEGSPLLLIHGFTGRAEAEMAGLMSEFQRDFRVIAPDLRGYGASRPPNRDYPLDFYQRDADDLAALIDALDCGPVTVLGFSDGAETAILLAASRPDLVAKIVGWGVSGMVSQEMVTSTEVWLPVAEWGAERQSWKENIIAWHGEEQFPSMIIGWVEALRGMAARGGNICYEEAAQVTCPVLLVNGSGEVGNTPRDVQRLAERIPDSQLVFIEGSGHVIQNDKPEELIQLIRNFLAQ